MLLFDSHHDPSLDFFQLVLSTPRLWPFSLIIVFDRVSRKFVFVVGCRDMLRIHFFRIPFPFLFLDSVLLGTSLDSFWLPISGGGG